MDYAKLLKGLIAEMKQGAQYKRMSVGIRVLAIIAMIPFILTFIIGAFFYRVSLFFYKALSAPSQYLQSWLKGQKDEVQHLTQAVMYLVCLPFIFFLQVLLSLSSFGFFFQWFGLMINGYLLSFGGIKWQPYINDATYDEDDTQYTYSPSTSGLKVFVGILFGVSILNVFLFLLSAAMPSGSAVFSIGCFIYSVLTIIVNPIICKRKVASQDDVVDSENTANN